MLLYLIKLHLLFLLIQKTYQQSPFQILTSDYDYTNYLQEMQKSCTYSPKTTLNLCSNKCFQCSASDSNKCSLCTPQFNNIRQECVLDNSIHSYSLYRYLQSGDINTMSQQISSFIDVNSNTNISSAKIVFNCKMDLYQMLLAGLFTVDDQIGIPYKLPYSIDQIQVKINFLSLIHDIKLIINVNEQTILNKNFTIFSDIGGIYGIRYKPNTLEQQRLYLLLYALDYSTVNNMITSVDTGTKDVIANDFKINLGTETNNTISDYKYYWGFSDVVVIQRRCETCVSKEVILLMSQVGEMCFIVGGVLCFLVMVLFSMTYIEEVMRKAKKKVKMGLVEDKKSYKGDNLPQRAIQRLFQAIERTKKGMQKDLQVKEATFKKHTKRK